MALYIVKVFRNTTECDTNISVIPRRGVTEEQVESVARRAARLAHGKWARDSGNINVVPAVRKALKSVGRVRTYRIITI